MAKKMQLTFLLDGGGTMDMTISTPKDGLDAEAVQTAAAPTGKARRRRPSRTAASIRRRLTTRSSRRAQPSALSRRMTSKRCASWRPTA